MRHKIHLLFLTAMTILTTATAQPTITLQDVHAMEQHLADVMEITDTGVVKAMLQSCEAAHLRQPTELNRARLGIVYHEVALNLGFGKDTAFKGYAAKSYALLSELHHEPSTTPALRPFVAAYRASALALMSGETRKLKLVGQAFDEFAVAVQQYDSVSYLPEFLRGSVAENLPWFFFRKKRFARQDFSAIIARQRAQPGYAGDKIMSFTYWAWAAQHTSGRHRTKALQYLEEAIRLDPDYRAGRAKAEALKQRWARKG